MNGTANLKTPERGRCQWNTLLYAPSSSLKSHFIVSVTLSRYYYLQNCRESHQSLGYCYCNVDVLYCGDTVLWVYCTMGVLYFGLLYFGCTVLWVYYTVGILYFGFTVIWNTVQYCGCTIPWANCTVVCCIMGVLYCTVDILYCTVGILYYGCTVLHCGHTVLLSYCTVGV